MRFVFGAFLVLSLGCGGAAGVEDSPPAGVDSAVGASSEWTAAPRRLGQIQFGMTVVAAERVIGAPFEPLANGGECVYRRTALAPQGVLFMQVGERIVRADITAPGVRTGRGIEVGASPSLVREAYGPRVSTSPHKYTSGHYLTVDGDAGYRMVFETDGQKVTRYRVGRLPEVEWVEGCS